MLQDMLREAFQKFDVGNKNCLTEDELRFCLTATGDHPLTEDEFREVLSRAQFDEVYVLRDKMNCTARL